MVEQQQTGLAVRQSVVVPISQERAFEVFTARLADWWPVDTHVIGRKPVVAAVIEPREGGRWFERSADGSECDWGRVLAWDPPERVVLAWQISPEWSYDAGLHTEIEVRFSAEDDGRTRVELEHRKLENYGELAEQMRGILGSDDGWGGLLRRFSESAAAS